MAKKKSAWEFMRRAQWKFGRNSAYEGLRHIAKMGDTLVATNGHYLVSNADRETLLSMGPGTAHFDAIYCQSEKRLSDGVEEVDSAFPTVSRVIPVESALVGEIRIPDAVYKLLAEAFLKRGDAARIQLYADGVYIASDTGRARYAESDYSFECPDVGRIELNAEYLDYFRPRRLRTQRGGYRKALWFEDCAPCPECSGVIMPRDPDRDLQSEWQSVQDS